MGRTFNQIKQSVLGKNFDVNSYSKAKTKKKDRTFNEIKNDVMTGKSDFSLVKKELEKRIGIDTFASDLSSIGKTIEDASNNWQTPETMQNTRLSAESMQNRLRAYKEYNQLFGGGKNSKDIAKTIESFGGVLDGWDARSEKYARYKNADAYNNETKALSNLAAMNSSDIENKMNEFLSKAPELEEKYKNAKKYDDAVKNITRNSANIRSATDAERVKTNLKKATEERDNYLKSIGFKSVSDIEKELSKSEVAYTTVGGENITWKSLYDSKKYQEDSDALYTKISSNDDFEKYKKEGANIKNPSFEESVQGPEIFGWRPFADEVQNKVEYYKANRGPSGMMDDEGIIYSEVTQQERDLYNYYLGREKAGLEKEGKADEYLNSISGVLKERHENAVLSGLSDYANEHPILASGLSVGQNLFAGAEYLKDSVNFLITGELDTNSMSKASSAIRQTVSEKVDWEIGNWDAFDFVYNTGMSMTDSIVSMATLGGAGGVALGLSAAAQGTNDAIERGLDNKSAFFSGLSAGVFEGLFESFSIGKFKALKEAPVDGLKTIIKNVGKSMLTNASEETLTELANITYDYFANGDLSQFATKVRAYESAGMSEKEAIRKVSLEQAAQVAEAGASGALMGFGFGAFGSGTGYLNSRSIGESLKINDRASDIFDMASISPETSLSYEAYTKYANKGINAENVKNAQLGSLWQSERADLEAIAHDKNSSANEVLFAKEDYQKLGDMAKYNPEARVKDKIAKETYKDTENVEALIESGLESGENTESYKLATELKAKLDNGKKITNEEINILIKANDNAIKDENTIAIEERASAMEKEDADLFKRLYDGKTDVDEYANAYELMKTYANNPNSFDMDYALENKGVLSTEQATEIYKATSIQVATMQKATDELYAQARKGERGIINDSIFNYGEGYVAGKVNWSNLNDDRKQAVVFAKGLYKKLGSNISFTGKDIRFNGMYDIGKDMTFIDVYAGMNLANLTGKDFIIPTISHELTHEMEVKSPELFKAMSDIVLNALSEKTGLSKNDMIADEIARLDKKHPDIKHTEADAISEIVARACEDLLAESKEARKIFKSLSESEQKTLVEKIKEIIQKVVDWIDEFLESQRFKSNSKEAIALREMKETFTAMSMLWDKMLLDVQKNNQALEKSATKESAANEDATSEGGIHFCERNDLPSKFNPDGLTLREQLVQAFDESESKERRYVYVGEFTQNFVDKLKEHITIKKLPIVMNYRDAYLSMKSKENGKYQGEGINYHNLGVSGLEAALKSFDNPEYVLLSKKEGKIELILEGRDYKNRQLFSIVEINTKAQHNKEFLPAHIVNSVYGNRGLKNRITNAEAEGRIIYNKKEESTQGMPQVQYERDINANSSKNIIRNSDRDVNTKFSDRDSEYLELAKDPVKNEARLREMVYEAAKEKGYTDDASWRMSHTAPNSQDDISLDNLKESGLVPDDFWEHPEWYTHSYEERESYYKVKKSIELQERRKSEGDPRDAHMWVYRAVDKTKNKREDYFRNGDWVTPSKEYAIREGKMNPNGYRIIKHSVKIKDLYWDGNSIAELGYDDGNNYAYADTLNNRKLLDLVTYDFEGNIIPLSKRFNKREYNVRYSDRDSSYMEAVESGDVETASKMIEDAAEKVFANSKVRGSDGKLRLVYHGRVSDFNVFDRQFANVEGDFGKGYYFTSNEYDVDANYANEEGPDLKNKIARLAESLEWKDEYSDLSYEEREEIARQRLITSEANTITAYLNMENPVYITPDENGTFLDFNEAYDEEYDEYGEPKGLFVDFIEALKNNSYDYAYNDVDFSFLYEYAFDNGGMYASDAVKVIKERILDELSDDEGNIATNEVIRLAFEEIGFDGIIDTSVYYKFKNMSGMDSGTTHYIVFNSNQIKSADIATYDDNGNVIPLSERFNTENEDIRYSLRNEIDSLPAEDKAIVLAARQRAMYSTSIATMSEGRLSKVYSDYSDSNPSTTNGYLAYIEPYDFLSLTTTSTEAFLKRNPQRLNEGVSVWGNENNIQKSGALYLRIDEQGNVVGHEGRHRMAGLLREGVNRVAVVIETSQVDNAKPVSIKKLSGQNFGNVKSYSSVYIHNMLPISKEYENINKHIFGDVTEDNKYVEPNIRYSDREDTTVYDILGETERLLKENERFKADIERLKERLNIERQVTHGNYFNENQLGAVAGHLRNIAHSNMDKVELMKALKDAYSFIAHSEHLTWEDVFMRCYNIAEMMLKESKPEKMIDDYSKQILRDIRNTRISLSESQKKEAEYIFGKNWNRNFFNRVTITDEGTPIDSMWQEWSGQYPDIFSADISDVDMIGELYDIIGSLQDASETIIEYNTEETTRWLANEIYNQYWNVSPIRTTADKYDKQIKRLNYEHRNAMKEIREKRDEKLKEQRKADKEKFTKLAKEIRERKDKEIAIAKERGKQRLESFKENAERKTKIQSITATSLSLNDMLIKNSKDKHIPEIMKEPVAALLKAIDFSSKRLLEKGEPTQKDISLSKALSKVKDMMVKATNAHDELVELYGHGLDEDIEKMVDSVDNIMRSVGDNEFVLNRMTLSDLQTLDKTVKTIKHAVNKLNKFHTVNHTRGIANLSRESVSYLDSLGKGKLYDGKRGAIKKLLDWGNALPYYVFKRFGSGGMKVYEALQDGWDKFAFNTKKIIDFANETYTNKEVKNWSNEVKTFKILLPTRKIDVEIGDYIPQYQEVQLTVPQIMSMYCLNKREQARGHLFQGGIRVADFKDSKGNVVSQSDGIVFTEADVRNILDSLTERQKAVADKLQEFMNTDCSDWGNEVSMARFGYKAFGEENYFPIQSDKNNLAVNDETEQPNSLFKLLNMSFTKSTNEKANNRIVISDIFDVFAQHTSDMAKYNALALPVLDAFKWYNFTEKENLEEGTFKTTGVKQSIEKAFGKDGQNYFTTFLKDINGQQEVSRDTLGKGFFSNAKITSVGANLRVILLQPTSYARASAVIDNKYLVKALGHKPKIKKAEKHCGIALWKSMGYYDTNIQKGIESQIKHNDTWKDKAIDWSMKGAEVADKVTWGYLWNACELEVREKRKDLKVGSEEFYTEIGKRLREVIYATQVVDSTMTRSQMMRSGDGWDKMLTSFASEPTLSYNMLQDAYMELSLDTRRMGKKEAWKKNGKRITRIVWAYTMTNALAALVESGFDAFREDDDEEMDLIAFMKLYLKNFAFDMSIGNKIPVIKELYSALQGYSSSRMDTQWAQYLYSAVNTKKPSTAIKNIIRTASQVFGLPFYNVYRDLMATLNKIDLFTAEDLNEMFEEFFD